MHFLCVPSVLELVLFSCQNRLLLQKSARLQCFTDLHVSFMNHWKFFIYGIKDFFVGRGNQETAS